MFWPMVWGCVASSMTGRSESLSATLRGLKYGRAAALFPLCDPGNVIFIARAQETLECGEGSRTQPHRRPQQKRLGLSMCVALGFVWQFASDLWGRAGHTLKCHIHAMVEM